MADPTRRQQSENAITVPRITIPEYVPPTTEELARRQELFAEIDRLREAIGPIGMSAVDLIDADFYDIDPE